MGMVTIEQNGKTYSVLAVGFTEDGVTTWSPSVCEISADGGCGRMLVDAETTDEVYTTMRECLQRAVINHVI
jgi:hypothetical protein